MSEYNNIMKLLQTGSYQLAAEKLNQISEFSANAGVKFTLISRDYAEGELILKPGSGIHPNNGSLFTLADSIASVAASSRGISYLTVSFSMNFLEATSTGKVLCNLIWI